MNGNTVIDLQERFGRRYMVRSEDGNTRSQDPWLAQIICHNGHIYPHGGEMLGAATSYLGSVAKTLRNLSCTRVVQDGDDGINVVFHVDDFDKVARVMRPRSRRVLSEEQKRRLRDASRKTRFKPGANDATADHCEPVSDPATLEAV